jgi:mannose-6-phosphate isomerase-like protein (cupin superfamily)
MDKLIPKILLAAAAAVVAVPAQEPTCRRCPATYIDNSELQAYTKRAIDNGLIDQQVRCVDAGKSQVGVGIVYRGKLDQPAKNSVAEHDFVSEVYHVIEGTATFVTGPDLVDAQQRPSSNQNVREFNGPGKNAASIRDGVTHHLKPGDVVVVPAGTGHLFTRIDDHILYLMVRIDPDKKVPLKDAAQSAAYLQSDVKREKDQ